MDEEPLALEYFSGGVPTGEFFRGTLKEIDDISTRDEQGSDGINRLQELCFIGLFSYFEAFCKDHFASLVNIEPSLIQNLKAAGHDVLIDAAHVALFGQECERRIGFLLASKYEFGTAKKINAIFSALLKVTPFSKDEAQRFDRFLLDRHLLVHHGGVFTLKYLEQATATPSQDFRTDSFMNSRTVGRQEVTEALGFVECISRKLLHITHERLTLYLKERGVHYSAERQKALHFVSWWGDSAAQQQHAADGAACRH